jgi:hypothetical protein
MEDLVLIARQHALILGLTRSLGLLFIITQQEVTVSGQTQVTIGKSSLQQEVQVLGGDTVRSHTKGKKTLTIK